MKFQDKNGDVWQDEVTCAQCGFHSPDTGLFRCPNDGHILGEHTVPADPFPPAVPW